MNATRTQVHQSLIQRKKQPQDNCTSGNLLFWNVHIIVQISRIRKKETDCSESENIATLSAIALSAHAFLKRRKELAIRLQKWLVDAFWCNLKPCNEDRNTRGTAVHGSSQQQRNSFSVLSLYTRLCRGQCQNFAKGFYSSGLEKEIKHLYFFSVQHRETKGGKAANLQRSTDLMILTSFLI